MRRRWVFIAVVLVTSVAAVYVEMTAMAVWGELRFQRNMSGQQPRAQSPDEDWVRRYSHVEVAFGAAIDADLYVTSGDFTGGGLYAEARVGWPMRSGQFDWSKGLLEGFGTPRPAESLPAAWRHGIEIPSWMRIEPSSATQAFNEGFRRIPIRPIWPGFAVNVLLNACVIGSLMLVPGWIVRARRRRRGACVGCGYAMAGLGAGAPCPECGKV